MMLNGKVALVTGARGGIGRAIVARFLNEGATVYAADLTPQGSLDKHDDDGSIFVKLDVTQEADAINAMETVRKGQGKLDILVNAAGIEIDVGIDDFQRGSHILFVPVYHELHRMKPLFAASDYAAIQCDSLTNSYF